MKSWIFISSLAWSLALPTHPSSAQTVAARLTAPRHPIARRPPVSTAVGPVVVPRSTVHHFQSKVVDDIYEVRVSVPEDYDNDDDLRPVIYALDGQWNFTLLYDIVGKLAFDGLIPDPIVVGITWADAGFQPAPERLRDFFPVALPDAPGSGGAANFLKVLETEVFPLVESNYRASTQRVITGGSAGGLFVSYALLERPDLFTGYVASSGATGAAQEYFTRRLAEIPSELLSHERAYFSVGALYDNEAEVRRFVGDVEAVAGKSANIVLDVVPGVGHTGNEPFAYTRGLLHAFQRPRLALTQHFLERYEGAYFDPAAPDAPDLIVDVGPDGLNVTEGGERWPVVFYAASPTRFYVEGVDIDIAFHSDDDGKLSFTLNYQRTPYEQVRH
jgi:predicted alpha/beta superfamily hydrolase